MINVLKTIFGWVSRLIHVLFSNKKTPRLSLRKLSLNAKHFILDLKVSSICWITKAEFTIRNVEIRFKQR